MVFSTVSVDVVGVNSCVYRLSDHSRAELFGLRTTGPRILTRGLVNKPYIISNQRVSVLFEYSETAKV